jgi:nicotinamide-nucleotide amidase
LNVELINTGSELMLGRVLNTHQQWLCRRLADLGYVVTRQVAIADTGREIEQAVREALGRAGLVITTGGLGPTSDDITRDLVAQLLGRNLHEDAEVLANIESFFAQRIRPMPVSTRVQALVPDGAIVLQNAHGTAPGLVMKVEDGRWKMEDGVTCSEPSSILHSPSSQPKWLIMLPGPPRELRPMFTDLVVPLLRRELPAESQFVCRTVRTTGIGESVVQEKIISLMEPLVRKGLEIGYCARVGDVDVRLCARGPDAAALVRDGEAIVREQLAKQIFGQGDEELEAVIVRLLTERKKTLALAESCTGGAIAHRITNVSGASAVLLAGIVSYSNQAKQKLLGVRGTTISQHGAVSEPVAREMAEGAQRETGADFALSVTGIAGPTGGSDAKPVGTVFIGLASAAGTTVLKQFNPFDRETFKFATGNQAMEMLRRALVEENEEKRGKREKEISIS